MQRKERKRAKKIARICSPSPSSSISSRSISYPLFCPVEQLLSILDSDLIIHSGSQPRLPTLHPFHPLHPLYFQLLLLLLYTMASTSTSSNDSLEPSTSSTRLYISNLHPTIDEFTLIQLFSKFGSISKLDFLFNKAGPNKGQPRGYCFLEFSKKEDAMNALVEVNGKVFRGRKIEVGWAKVVSNGREMDEDWDWTSSL